jgi:hypothetical protein
MNEMLPQPAAGEDWASRYEQLRNEVLSHAVGGGLGLILFLRQGLIAWMRASSCTVMPVPPAAWKSVPPWNTISPVPDDIRSQAAVILAGILLSHPRETTLCKATCTK